MIQPELSPGSALHYDAAMWSMSAEDRRAMAFLLSPCTVEEFEAGYYEKAPLHVSRNTPGYYDAVFSLAELERVLYGMELRKSDLAIVKDGIPARPDTYLKSKPRTKENERDPLTELIDADRVSALFAGGCSVVLDGLSRFSTPVASFCRELEMLFRHRVNPNLYLTPPGNQGFAVHYDTHDTAIMQIEGTKRWRIYESAYPLPLDEQKYNKQLHPVGNVLIETDVKPGDFLYIPRGFLHEAKSNEGLSLHVTLGLYPRRWIQVLKTALDEAAEAPASVLLRESAVPESVAAIAELLQHLLSERALLDAEQHLRSTFERERRNGLEGQMSEIARLTHLCEGSHVAMRPAMLYEIEENEKSTRLLFSGKTLVFGHGAAALIHDLSGGRPVPVSSLLRHDEKALTIVRKLIQEGFAQQVQGNEHRDAEGAVA